MMQIGVTNAVAIGLDIGGTKIGCGAVTADGQVLEQTTLPTPNIDEGAAIMAVMVSLIEKMRARHPEVQTIGVGAPGVIDWPAGRISWAPNNAFRDLDVGRLLREATG